MPDHVLEADYVIVGAGAAAMAFADTLLTESDASLILVDRRARAGGHWNDAYPFVRLHSTSAFYGVNSTPLGSGRMDTVGWNRGHLELSSSQEICGYFDDVMRYRFLPSGRVTFLSNHDYHADGTATSRLSGRRTRLIARRRIVDGTHAGTEIPATHPPGFAVATGLTTVTPNELPKLQYPSGDFIIIGGGKTAVDCVLWLLEQDVDPGRITWIRPRDSWFYNRKRMQPHAIVVAETIQQYVHEAEAASGAGSLADLFRRLEASRALLRIDPGVAPEMFHCATVTEEELAQLRRVRNVVRAGRVKAVELTRIVLEQGEIATNARNIHVHCASRGVPVRPSAPVFQDHRIVLQFLYQCWPPFSAAMIAYLEAHRSTDAERNRLAMPVPMADKPIDWLSGKLAGEANEALWMEEPDIMEWRASARLDSFTKLFNDAEASGDPALTDLLRRLYGASPLATAKLKEFVMQAAKGGQRAPDAR
jgi:hypothetical protein